MTTAFNPERWIASREASRRMGCSRSAVCAYAKAHGWETRIVPARHQGACERIFRVEDVEREAEARRMMRGAAAMPLRRIRELVEWADALTEWPRDEEIEARTDSHYRFKDVVSVIESRKFRGLDPLSEESRLCRDPSERGSCAGERSSAS